VTAVSSPTDLDPGLHRRDGGTDGRLTAGRLPVPSCPGCGAGTVLHPRPGGDRDQFFA